MKKIKLEPPQAIVLSFFSVILLGALLLNLPISARENVSPGFLNSLFTATSATCVTGLIVKDTGSFFSPFGRMVILMLIQAGGLGIMTFSTMFAIALGRKLSISQNVTIQKALGHTKIQGLPELILYIVKFTLSIELIGAALLYLRWASISGTNTLADIERAVFHSVSAFCNAGFSLFSKSLQGFYSDGVVLGIFSALIIIGGMGFIVFLDIPKLKFWRKDRRLIFSRISIQTKMVFLITFVLIIIGAAGVWLLESNNTLSGMAHKDKLSCSLFASITPRTAGFNVLPTNALRPATLFMLIILMFIGASPGSTGGGIKTVTFGVMVVAFVSMLYNRDRISVFRKTIPRQTYRRAAVIVFLGLGVIALSTFLLSITEAAASGGSRYFLNILFEVTSAFGTVGLSTGITPGLSGLGKFIIICTMFIGRVGPLTIALAVAMRKERIGYIYPEEKLMVG
ncbi:MAG: potassium transporter TrkG [Candidatus Omnitrophota bacterium]